MLEVNINADDLRSLARALHAEAEGKAMRRELGVNIRRALAPAVAEARAGIMGMPSVGPPHPGQPLRATIARNVRAEARLSGRSAGARVRANRTPALRGFTLSARRTNRTTGWRHPVFGDRAHWVAQHGQPDWFDRPLRANRDRYRHAVVEAMDATARRIAVRTKVG